MNGQKIRKPLRHRPDEEGPGVLPALLLGEIALTAQGVDGAVDLTFEHTGLAQNGLHRGPAHAVLPVLVQHQLHGHGLVVGHGLGHAGVLQIPVEPNPCVEQPLPQVLVHGSPSNSFTL